MPSEEDMFPNKITTFIKQLQTTTKSRSSLFLKRTPKLTLLTITPNILNLNTLMFPNTNNQLSTNRPLTNQLLRNQLMMMTVLMLSLMKLMIKEEKLKSEDTNQEDIQMTTTRVSTMYQEVIINLKRQLFNLLTNRLQFNPPITRPLSTLVNLK